MPMTESERLLAELWADDEPPMRDTAFSLAVMEAVAKRRFRRGLANLAAVTVAMGAVVWALAPSADAMSRALAQAPVGDLLGPVAAAVFLAWSIWTWATDPERRIA
jgi:hypothetical protein